ncbi:MAG: ABC transporter ATP-binding protein [Acidobacteria bacterium]|nr:ABC transporter ATP-binding protein [Acidobacteriota bacterium]
MPAEPARDSRRLSAALRLVLARYGAQVRRRPVVSIAALLLPGLGNLLIFYGPPVVVARLVAAFAREGELALTEAWPYVAAMAALWASGEVIWRLAGFTLARAEVRGMEALYIEAMRELLARDVAFFHDNFAGSLTKRALGYARQFEQVFDVLAFSVVANLMALVLVGVVLWTYSPLLVAVLLAMLVTTFVLVLPRVRRRQQLVDAREAASNAMAGHLADSIANAEAVRAFAREPEEAAVHAGNVYDYGAKTLRSWDFQNLRIDIITAPMYVATNVLGLVVVLWTRGTTGASLEAVLVTFSYYAASTRVMWEFNRIYRTLESALTDAAQFADLLLDPPVVVDTPAPRRFAPADFGLELDRVTFSYGPSSPRLFDQLSLSIPAGRKVGFVGRSGGGKTTLTRLLLRFMDPDAGQIRIGGLAIDQVPLAALRQAIAYVPQDPSMFHRSIADNIRFGRPGATDAEVREAARLAHAAEFIEALPDGYETLVGERGVKLSGGQRQRVAIARAILKNAPILVLDEATSALDSESEALIQEALWTLMEGRTAIVIAHRLSTVRRMDELVVLDRGRVIERGAHDVLLAGDGVYAALWARQSGGFLGVEAAATG